MKTKIYATVIILLATMLSFKTQELRAQVTIGSTTSPNDFSVLQLELSEGEKGFRLPQLNQSECNSLKNAINGKQPAKGLVVYNSTTNKVQYWNGSSDWIILDRKGIAFSGENGVSVIDNTSGGLQLGGNLNKNMQINMGNWSLNFPTQPGGQFIISSPDDFIVTNDKVGIGTSTPNTKIEVKSDTPDGLRISNSGEKPDYLMASDASGNGTWKPLKPLSSIVSGTIYNNVDFKNSAGGYVRVSDELTLPKGKWLIMAKFTAKRDRVNGLYIYGELNYLTSTGSTKTAVNIGTLPEQTVSNSTCYATPQIFYYTELTENTTFWVSARTSHDKENVTSSDYGGGYFYAIRIDK